MGRQRLRGGRRLHHGDGRRWGQGGHGGLVCLICGGRECIPPVGPPSSLTCPDLLLSIPAAGVVRPQPVLRYLRAVLCPVRSQPEAGCRRWDGSGWALAKVPTLQPCCCPQPPASLKHLFVCGKICFRKVNRQCLRDGFPWRIAACTQMRLGNPE